MLPHYGPYDQISGAFDQLWNWASSNGVNVQRMIGVYYDNPDYTPAAQLRSAACVEVPPGFQIGNSAGLPLQIQDLAGGQYATTRFVGPYEDLAPVWTNFTNYIEGTLRLRISDNPAFEIYLNDPSNTPANQLITDLYMPLV